MQLALFHCCHPRVFLKQGESITLLFKRMGIACVEINDFNCCGYPVKNINFMAYVTASARNLALAQRRRLNIVTYCSCCFGSMKQVRHIMRTDADVSKKVNATLKKEGLAYTGDAEVKHYLEVCHNDVGLDVIAQMVTKPFKNMKVAAQHGCHLLRPRHSTQFDNPSKPLIYDQLIGVTGAESVDWPNKLTCCSAPMEGINDRISMDILQNKIEKAGQAGADCVCTACANCQLQFDKVQKMLVTDRGLSHPVPSLSYIQLLGLSFGIEPQALYLDQHEIETNAVMSFQ
jgi:heterodisulfide reductase subunit B